MSFVQSPGSSGEAELDTSQPPAAPPAQLEKLEPANVLQVRASRMFLRAGKDPIESGNPPVASAVTNKLVTAVRAAIRALFKAHRDDICRSPERPDLMLSQEEAMGYLIADALSRPLLAPLDARPVGKRIDTRASAVEKQLAAMPRVAAEAARKAGAAAKKTGGPFDAKQHYLRCKRYQNRQNSTMCNYIDRRSALSAASGLLDHSNLYMYMVERSVLT